MANEEQSSTASMAKVEMFTDGACKGNPGRGGWGVILRYKDVEKELYGGEQQTTNNRMEMTAIIQGLKQLKRPCQIELTTDSKYVLDGVTKWLAGWKKNNWKNSAKKPVKNSDLWLQLDSLISEHQINWHWIKGHSGHRENERADELANLGVSEL